MVFPNLRDDEQAMVEQLIDRQLASASKNPDE